MAHDWYRRAIFYSLDVECFQDSRSDGIGDFRGLIERLEYLEWLGIDAIWLMPFYPSPNRDDGYDVSDYLDVDARLGDLADFDELIAAARERGMRVVTDLVVNHTSDQHPWFQEARRDPRSARRDWYVWTDDPSRAPSFAPIFPGEQDQSWTYDEVARAYYLHRFYSSQPDLNIDNPAVRNAIADIMRFWLARGVAGFRVDAAPILIERFDHGSREVGKLEELLTMLRRVADGADPPAILLAEANVPADEIPLYFGAGDRMHMIFGFLFNQWSFVAHARQSAAPLRDGIARLPERPSGAQWLHFLRHHDELTLDQLDERHRREVLDAFAPDPAARIYGRGIRHRLLPIFGGDRCRAEMALALSFALPGTPMIRYGDEIGMGDDLSLPGRMAVRTVMQWTGEPGAGFSRARPERWARPVVSRGPYGHTRVNVAAQRGDPRSLLSRTRALIHTRRALAGVFGAGHATLVEGAPESVFAHRFDGDAGSVLCVHQLADRAVELGGLEDAISGAREEVARDARSEPWEPRRARPVTLAPFGYRWWLL